MTSIRNLFASRGVLFSNRVQTASQQVSNCYVQERNFDASNYSNDEKSNLRHCTKDKLNIHDTNIEQDLSIIPDTLKKRTSIFNSSCILKTQTIYKNFQF